MGQTMKKRMVELWSCGEANLEETKLFHSSPGADVGKAGLWETRKAVSEVHGSLDVVMVHLIGRVVGQVMAESVTSWHCQVHVSFPLLPELLCVPKWQLLSDSIFCFRFWFSEQPLGQPHVLQPGRNLV